MIFIEPSIVAALVIFTAAFYWALSYYLRGYLTGRWGVAMAVAAGLLPLLGAYLTRDAPASLALCLLAAMLINAELSLRFTQAWFALIALFAALLVPAFIGQGVAVPSLSIPEQAWAYVVLAAFLVLWRRQLAGLGESFDAVGITGYLLAVLTALAYALIAGPATTLAVGLVLAVGLYTVSRREPLPEAFTYISNAIAACALTQLIDIYNWPVSINGLILATFGSLLYLAGRRSEPIKRGGPMRYSGIILAFLGIYPGLLGQIPPLSPVLALTTGAFLLWLEARLQRSVLLLELSLATMVLAFDWTMLYEGIAGVQYYTLPVVAYFVYLAYRRRDLTPDNYVVPVIAALAFLTVPLAVQVFLLGVPAYTLILEAIVLVFVGSGTGYRLISRWGFVTMAAAVLFITPYVFNLLSEFFLSLQGKINP